MRATFDETVVFHKEFDSNCPEETIDELYDEYVADAYSNIVDVEGFMAYLVQNGYEVSNFDDGQYNFDTTEFEFCDYYQPKSGVIKLV